MFKAIAITLLLAASAAAQSLTPAQKETDFRYMVSLYETYYAPLDWKKQLLQVDALDIKPWLERVAKTTTDLDFYEVCADYVSAFQDTHSSFSLPSDFLAQLGFTVDLFDNIVLIDTINRTLLPVRDFPFVVGDEVVSVDGVLAEQLISNFVKYSPQGNPRSARRLAAARIPTRPQSRMPHAVDLGDKAIAVIRRQNGDLETYTITWTKTGTSLEVGLIPPYAAAAAKRETTAARQDYMKELEEIQHSGVSQRDVELGVLNYGARNPIFLGGLGTGFTRRMGGAAADFYYSGVFRFDGLNIGYLRVPSYSPPSQALALAQLDNEIAFFRANTDGLIVDGMRNPGGNLCFGESVMARFSLDTFRTTGFELRAFWGRTLGFYNAMINAKSANASPEVIEQYEKLYQAMLTANGQNRGVTEPIPICTSSLDRDPLKDRDGMIITYSKPMMMLIDEFSTSTGDSVPSMFQENGRGLLYGMRSNGAGGNNINLAAGPYSQSTVGMTIGLQVRRTPVNVTGYPQTGRIENVGVHPDVVNDYMTRDNLLQNGAPFVRQFLEAMAAYIRR